MKRLFYPMLLLSIISCCAPEQLSDTVRYMVSIPDPESHVLHIEMLLSSDTDSLQLYLPAWTPGYYQLIDYAADLSDLEVHNGDQKLSVLKTGKSSWIIPDSKSKNLKITYEINTKRSFVATSYVDSSHAYIVGANTFLYPNALDRAVQVLLSFPEKWQVVTGLSKEKGYFQAANYDLLYDSPILIGSIEQLDDFSVNGVTHHFAGVDLGEFDKADFIQKLERVVTASAEVIGHIPYDDYTFIAIGPGRGGIEHLNNTTVSFDGNELKDDVAMKRMLNFLAHEHFHHYNVKRIRPMELGPFDYQKGSRTNMLWLSEGVTVYYEYLILYRASIITEAELLSALSEEINALQHNPGRLYQSLREASYDTWHDGPFGEIAPDKSISVYNKGAVFGFILDLAIRQASANKASLDHVMRAAYQRYYLDQNRGFTEAEFQQLCEEMSGSSLQDVFSYIYDTREMAYEKYLDYVGLSLDLTDQWKLKKQDQMGESEGAAYSAWIAR